MPNHFAGQDENSEGTEEPKQYCREHQNEPLLEQLQHNEELVRASLHCVRSLGADPAAAVSLQTAAGICFPCCCFPVPLLGGRARAAFPSSGAAVPLGAAPSAPQAARRPEAAEPTQRRPRQRAGGARRGGRAEARPHGAISTRPGRPRAWEALPGAGRCAPPASCTARAAGELRRRGGAARAARPPLAPLLPPAPR